MSTPVPDADRTYAVRPDRYRFGAAARRITIGLLAVAVTAWPTVPSGLAAADAWRFVGRHPSLLLHIALGLAVLTYATVVLVRTLRRARPAHIAAAAAGLALILLAAISGDLAVLTQELRY